MSTNGNAAHTIGRWRKRYNKEDGHFQKLLIKYNDNNQTVVHLTVFENGLWYLNWTWNGVGGPDQVRDGETTIEDAKKRALMVYHALTCDIKRRRRRRRHQ